MTEATIGDLPPEVHAHILQLCVPRDAEALGATCHMMRAVARDPHLWRYLFERDFGHIYPMRTGHTRWPANGALRDPWVDAVCRAWGVKTPSVYLPPVGESWVPQPFMHMQSAGKDARWLYIFHATGGHKSDAPATLVARALGDHYWVSFDPRRTLWIEQADCRAFHWRIFAHKRLFQCSNTLEHASTTRLVINRSDGSTTWESGGASITTLHFRIEGPFPQTLRQACVRQGRLNIDGTLSRVRDEYSDGSVTDKIVAARGDYSAVTRYSNGDCVYYRLESHTITQIDKFVCSEDCPVAEFAGRSLCPAEWRWSTAFLAHDDHDEVYFWPRGDSDDALAFCDYVRRGLIGWHPRLREVALARIDA
ncbi:F-box domain containing protein [Pandoravirus salinus]|uniref:F-box domain containing protein n=1 Tax=Pandoravirus salinus TaxID=1349410 RepID=S4W4U5_9VIRU|nr:F-box domain [Pandoravirus salinus]AGO85752.1 F-box domain containing protein [Pandoravirus salinus]